MERSQLLLYIGVATFFLVVFIAGLLIFRGGRSKELAATIAEVRKVGEQVENMRSQNSNEHSPMQDYLEWTYNQVRRIMARLGFLDDKTIPEPPISPRKPVKDDIA